MSEQQTSDQPQTNQKKVGTKAEVWNGEAIQTRGKLKKDNLMVNARGKVISKKSHERGKALQQQLASAGSKKINKT